MKLGVKREIQIGRYKISYFQKGQGTPLIWLHGIPGNSLTFRYLINYFTVANKVIIPDLPGCGDSSKPLKFDYSLKSLSKLLNKFVEQLKIKKMILGGVSTGGVIAARFVLDYPDLVEKLVITDSPLLDSAGRFHKLVNKSFNDLWTIYSGFFHKSPDSDDKMIKALRRSIIDEKAVACCIKFFDDNPDFKIKELEKLVCPTMIIWGERDNILPNNQAEKLVKKIADSRFVMIPEAGHLPPDECPEDFGMIVQNFIKGGIPRLN